MPLKSGSSKKTISGNIKRDMPLLLDLYMQKKLKIDELVSKRIKLDDVNAAFEKRDSFGMSGMRERVALLGGKFQVESRMTGPKTGTKIFIELPIAK